VAPRVSEGTSGGTGEAAQLPRAQKVRARQAVGATIAATGVLAALAVYAMYRMDVMSDWVEYDFTGVG
jgi:hypothetical protein